MLASRTAQTPVVAISACLLGRPVRYDGGDKRQPILIECLQSRVQWLPICPEVLAGLGVPRPPVQLVQNGGGTRALGRDDIQLDVTQALLQAGNTLLTQLTDQGATGLILQSRSPSCGLGSTPLYAADGTFTAFGNGLVADYLYRCLPGLIIVEETAMQSAQQCELFLQRCLAALPA